MAKSPTRGNRENRKPKGLRPQPETDSIARNAAPGAAAVGTGSPARKPKGGA